MSTNIHITQLDSHMSGQLSAVQATPVIGNACKKNVEKKTKCQAPLTHGQKKIEKKTKCQALSHMGKKLTKKTKCQAPITLGKKKKKKKKIEKKLSAKPL